ncbi:nickel insertion protein [Peptoniphilus stercorisuis]|uniref:Uncharacterized protein (DUF111 family) n=1 Tax=Peptoniphilus stercorisuis TaxID=1436965 RepID=A0ABS4KCT6_9FIRM|nr:nickel insertion protein [Peptoniphilus stercorisuis]MBP2025601.1 uncharacterized protein (DUF111 family) [Peptoniphilus stercorisuis]
MGFVIDLLLEKSLDVFYTPIFMKKNRPAYKLSVLCNVEKEEEILDIIFKHTTTIGIRKYFVERDILKREIIDFKSSFGDVKLKIVFHKDNKYIYPEYESIKKIAIKEDISIIDLYREVVSEYEKKSKFNL